MREAYQTPYGFPNLDPVRHEASLSIILGLFQAGITMTNHLVEALMKIAIISMEAKEDSEVQPDQEKDVVDSFIDKHKPSQDKYGAANLYNNINKVFSLGLIDDAQKDYLQACRENFRNAYGHADKAKTFGQSVMPVQGIRLHPDGFELQEQKEVKVADLLIGQGIAQAIIAERSAPVYFLSVDAIARQILKRIFGDDIESSAAFSVEPKDNGP
jgi:hypothetical protein